MIFGILISSKIRKKIVGSGVLSDKMLLVRIVENNKIDDYLGQVKLGKSWLHPVGLGKGL